MKLIVSLSIICALTTITTGLLIWYLRGVLSKLLYVSESMGDFLVVIDNYASHLSSVYDMEMFYGDETIEALMKHTQAVVDEVEEFSSIYSLTTDMSEDKEDEEGEELDEDTEEYEEELVAN